MIPNTVGELCLMLIRTGECKDGKIWHDKQHKKDYVTCIEGCKKLDGFIDKYWRNEESEDKE